MMDTGTLARQAAPRESGIDAVAAQVLSSPDEGRRARLFHAMARHFWNEAPAIGARRCSDPERVQDAIAFSLEQLWARFPTFGPELRWKGWLVRVMDNELTTMLRHERRALAVPQPLPDELEVTPVLQREVREQLVLIAAVVAELPPDAQLDLRAHALYGGSIAAIAWQRDEPESTVRMRLQRTLARFEARLRRVFDEGRPRCAETVAILADPEASVRDLFEHPHVVRCPVCLATLRELGSITADRASPLRYLAEGFRNRFCLRASRFSRPRG